MTKTVFAAVGALTTVAGAALITAGSMGAIKGFKWLKENADDTVLPFEDGAPFENSRYYREGDYAIHYRIDHSKKAETKGKLFMIHGFACNSTFYDEMVEVYTYYGFDCVRVDAPGNGCSTRENENVAPIDREQLFLHVMDLVDQSGEVPAGKWVLVGHSMGGGIAMNMAHDNPERFSTVVLYAPMAAVNAPQFVKNLVTLKPVGNFLDNLFIPIASWDPIMKAVVMLMTVDVRYSILYDVHKFSDGLTAPGSWTSMCYMMARARPTLHDEMGQVDLPIQLVWGQMDLFNTKGTIRKFQAALKEPEVSVVKMVGHCLVQNAAREVCDSTVEFLKKHGIYA